MYIFPTGLTDIKYQHNDCVPTESQNEGKYQESIQSSTTPDPGYQLDITYGSQEVSHFPTGDHMASTNRHAWKTHTSLDLVLCCQHAKVAHIWH